METFRALKIWSILNFSNFILLQLKPAVSLNLETINLNPQLKLFQDCSVQVVLNHVTTHVQDKFNFSEIYNVLPLSFPIVLLSLKYKPISFSEILNGKIVDANCDGSVMTLLPNQGPKFRRIPDPRHKCFVQVYIDPLPCQQWTTAKFDKERPSGIFDIVIDPRLFSDWPRFTIGNRVMIHVTKWRKSNPNNVELLQAVALFWEIRNSVVPTKLIFLIRYSELSKQFNVVETSVLTCKDYSLIIENIKKACKGEDFLATLACEYFQANLVSGVLARKLIYNNTSIQTREELDTAIYGSADCQNVIWLAVMPVKTYSQKGKARSTYVNELSSINGENNLNAKAVLFGILFPNATILGYKYDEYLFIQAFFMWKLPGFHTPDRLSAAMDTTTYSSKMKSVHFITCAPPQTSGWLSLIDLFSSFTLAVWFLIILVSILTGLCVWAILEIRNNVAKCRKRGYSNGIWMAVEHIVFVWKMLLQQGSSRSLKCWCICAAWLLMGTFLTNLYLGGNITNLSAPIEARNIESFEELFSSNFTIYSPVNDNEKLSPILKLITNAGQLGHLLYNTFSGVIKQTNKWDHEPTFSKLMWKNRIRYNYSDNFVRKVLSEKAAKISQETVEDVEAHINEDQKVEIISQCKMEVYMDTYENIQRLKLKLVNKLPTQKIAMSKKPFDEMYENWELENVPVSANIILRRFHSLFQSGLIHWWKSWAFRVSTWNMTVDAVRNVETGYKAVSIEGNIQALFYLYLGIFAFDIVIFILEMCTLIYCIIQSGDYNLSQLVLALGGAWKKLSGWKPFNRLVSFKGLKLAYTRSEAITVTPQ
ncbi:unnamed protein product [Orchesella dallaii]|uniref:Uncharacterized protein n=1 Tax=Orchesella dallaii TaxID=48710 RepID=A0ABP1RQ58_9HEXA